MHAAQRTVVVSINSSWNILNFRLGLVRRLQAEGFRVVAVSPDDAHSRALAENGVEHVPIVIDNKGLSPRRDLRLLRDYVRILRRVRPSAYLGWTIKPNVYGSLAARLLGIPVINNVSGLGTAFIRKGPLTVIASALYRLAFRRSARVFFQNDDDRQLFVQNRLVEAARTGILPGSGIDLRHFAPAEQSPHAAGPVVFLLIARLLRDKGVAEYVAAAELVRSARPGTRFCILGFLDIENRTAISRAEVESWVAAGTIEYLGDAADVRPFIRAADCVVLPSYREGLPRTLLEASAMARPLVATDVPGCRDIARPGQNAFLCAPRDARSLADAMIAMADLSPAERTAMGAAGRRLAEAEFDERIVHDRYIKAICATLA